MNNKQDDSINERPDIDFDNIKISQCDVDMKTGNLFIEFREIPKNVVN